MRDEDEDDAFGVKQEEKVELYLKYLWRSEYLAAVRERYKYFTQLEDHQKASLVTSAQLLRVNQENIYQELCSDRAMLAIVVYGKVSFGASEYGKGNYFQVLPQPGLCLALYFVKKSAVFLFDRENFEGQMSKYEDYYTKKNLIERTLPIDRFKMTLRRLTELINAVHIEKKQGEKNLLVQAGPREEYRLRAIYIVFEGRFAVESKKGVKLLELSEDYFGEEVIWQKGYEFSLRPESHTFKCIRIPCQLLSKLKLLTPERVGVLREDYSKRKKVRQDLERNFNKNISYMKKFIKIKEGYKPKQTKMIQNKRHTFKLNEKKEFEKILQATKQKRYLPKWMKEEIELEQARKKKLRQEHKYRPVKIKGKSFSTLTAKYFSPAQHQQFDTEVEEKRGPLVFNLTLYERIKATKQLNAHYFSQTLTTARDEDSPIKIKRTMSTLNTEAKTHRNFKEEIQALQACLTDQQNPDDDEHTIKIERWCKLPSENRYPDEKSFRRPSTADPTVSFCNIREKEPKARANSKMTTQSVNTLKRIPPSQKCTYYSLNYDRTYSRSISQKAKLQKYGELLVLRSEMLGEKLQTISEQQKSFQEKLEKLDKTWQDAEQAKKQERRRRIMREHLKRKVMSGEKFPARRR